MAFEVGDRLDVGVIAHDDGMKTKLGSAHHFQVGALGRPGCRIGKAQYPGIQLAAYYGLDQVGARFEFDQLDIQTVFLVKTAFVSGDGLCVVHDAQVADLEFIGGHCLAGHSQRGQCGNQ